MGSSRLPGKVLMHLQGKTVLGHIIERLQRSLLADSVVIATSTNAIDQPIAELAIQMGIKCFRGDEHDVLSRYYHTARTVGANIVIRCNGDCPLIDPAIVDEVITLFLSKNSEVDYVSNILHPTYPTGMHTEVFHYSALEKAFKEASDPLEREHVTPYLYRHPHLFKLKSLQMSPDLSWHRWTLDYHEDLILIRRIYAYLYPQNKHFTMRDVLELLDRNKNWSKINGNIQKKATV